MEASNGLNDYFSTNPNVYKFMAFAFEYPMSGTKGALFADDKNGDINAGIRNYILSTFSPDPNPNYSNSKLDSKLMGYVIRFSLLSIYYS